MDFVGCASSDKGLRRARNEDSFAYEPELGLFLVADGVGGHAAGEVASHLAALTVVTRLREIADADLTPVYDPKGYPGISARRLLIAIEDANDKVHQTANSDPSCHGMGTTIAAVLMYDGFANVAHVGDSRVYRIRDGTIERLTEDHLIMPNVLSRALGSAPTVEASYRIEPLQPTDTFLLCTDGIHGLVSDEEILATVASDDGDYAPACAALIALANDRGGPDNSTVIIVRAASV